MDAATVTTITSSVDFAEIITGMGAIFAAVALVLIARKGGRLLMSVVK